MIEIKDCNSLSDVAKAIGYTVSGNGIKKAREYVQYNNLDISHFRLGKKAERYKEITKPCPVCGEAFTTKLGHSKEKVTCSSSCANTHFRTGSNHPNWKEPSDKFKSESVYRRICFSHHEKKCIICGEENIVAVHHYDENHENNLPENLVPLCPTHHQYVHSTFKHLVQTHIDAYVKGF